MEDRIIITRERPEIEKHMAEGHEHIATRNGIEYVFRLRFKKHEAEHLTSLKKKTKE